MRSTASASHRGDSLDVLVVDDSADDFELLVSRLRTAFGRVGAPRGAAQPAVR